MVTLHYVGTKAFVTGRTARGTFGQTGSPESENCKLEIPISRHFVKRLSVSRCESCSSCLAYMDSLMV